MFEENEISKNANGGTEIAKRTLQELIDPELKKHFQIISSRVRELDESKIRVFLLMIYQKTPSLRNLVLLISKINFISLFL